MELKKKSIPPTEMQTSLPQSRKNTSKCLIAKSPGNALEKHHKSNKKDKQTCGLSPKRGCISSDF